MTGTCTCQNTPEPEQLGPIQSAIVRTAAGTLQLGSRRWHWIWETRKGRVRIGRVIRRLLGTIFACFAAYRISTTWPLAGGAIICAVLAWGYHKAEHEQDQDAQPAQQLEPEIPLSPEEIVLQLVVDLIGDASGIHLDVLLDRLREVPQWAAMERDELRLILHAAGCPIRRALRVGQRTGIAGVHRDDAQTALHALGEDDTPLPPPDSDPDL